MLLYNKSKIIIKHKRKDMFYTITWKHLNKLNNYHVSIEKYINGYLYAGDSKTYILDNLDILENKLDNFVNVNNCTIKAY